MFFVFVFIFYFCRSFLNDLVHCIHFYFLNDIYFLLFYIFANMLQDSLTDLRVGRADIQRVHPTVKSIYLSLCFYIFMFFAYFYVYCAVET